MSEPANFASDNVAGALPEVVAALNEAASGDAMPYGADPWTDRVTTRLRDIFETDLWAFPVATATAANAPGPLCDLSAVWHRVLPPAKPRQHG